MLMDRTGLGVGVDLLLTGTTITARHNAGQRKQQVEGRHITKWGNTSGFHTQTHTNCLNAAFLVAVSCRSAALSIIVTIRRHRTQVWRRAEENTHHWHASSTQKHDGAGPHASLCRHSASTQAASVAHRHHSCGQALQTRGRGVRLGGYRLRGDARGGSIGWGRGGEDLSATEERGKRDERESKKKTAAYQSPAPMKTGRPHYLPPSRAFLITTFIRLSYFNFSLQ